MKLIFLMTGLCISSCLNAQQWIWDTILNEPDMYCNYEPKLVKDNTNNVFVYLKGCNRILKFDSSMKYLWEKDFEGDVSLREIIVSDENEIYVLGEFSNSLQFESLALSSVGSVDIFIAKFADNDSIQFLKRMGSLENDIAGGICILNDYLVVSGLTGSDADFDGFSIYQGGSVNFFLAKFNTYTGSFINSKFAVYSEYYLPGMISGRVKIACDQEFNLVHQWEVNGVLTFDSDTIQGIYSSFILKSDSSFNVLWYKEIESEYYDHIDELAIDYQGNIFFNYLSSHKDFHYAALAVLRADGSDTSICLIAESGSLIGLNSDSNYYFYSSGYKSYPSGNENFPDVYSLMVAQLVTGGEVKWLKLDSSLSFRAATDVIPLASNKFLVSGIFRDTIILNDTLTDFQPEGQLFLATLFNQNTANNDSIKEKKEIFDLFPNPNGGIFTVRSSQPISSISIINPIGKNIHTSKFVIHNSLIEIDISAQSPGIYFLETEINGIKERQKIIKK